MLEPQDIQKMMEVLATKEDIRGVGKSLSNLDTRLADIDRRLDALDNRSVNI